MKKLLSMALVLIMTASMLALGVSAAGLSCGAEESSLQAINAKEPTSIKMASIIANTRFMVCSPYVII